MGPGVHRPAPRLWTTRQAVENPRSRGWICYAALLDELPVLAADFVVPDPPLPLPEPLLPEPLLEALPPEPPLPDEVEPVDEVDEELPEPLADDDSDLAATELPPVEPSDPFARESVR